MTADPITMIEDPMGAIQGLFPDLDELMIRLDAGNGDDPTAIRFCRYLKHYHPDLYNALSGGHDEEIADRELVIEVRRRQRGLPPKQIRPSTKKVRGIAEKTKVLRGELRGILGETDKPISVRHGYYLAESRHAVDKTEGGYRRVQRQLLIMRREGIIPYGWISDGTRWRRKPDSFDSVNEALSDTKAFYRRNVWSGLNVYVEIWCEKDSISGVLYPVTSEYDVPLMIARGDSSETFAYESAQEIRGQGKPAFVYYVGDLDPAGWDMSRVLEEKLRGFGADIEFHRLAVNREQIDELKLSTRPTKASTRTPKFYKEFGDGMPSVELEAIPPDTLRRVVRDAIEQHIPKDHLDKLAVAEESEREIFGKLMTIAARETKKVAAREVQ